MDERIENMADAKTEKQKVKEITDKLEEGLKELFESEKYKGYLSTMSKFLTSAGYSKYCTKHSFNRNKLFGGSADAAAVFLLRIGVCSKRPGIDCTMDTSFI